MSRKLSSYGDFLELARSLGESRIRSSLVYVDPSIFGLGVKKIAPEYATYISDAFPEKGTYIIRSVRKERLPDLPGDVHLDEIAVQPWDGSDECVHMNLATGALEEPSFRTPYPMGSERKPSSTPFF